MYMKKICLFAAAAVAALSLASCGQSAEEASDTNPVVEAIMARRSIRQYKDTPVEREKLETLAQCGIAAPSGMNSQPWELRIVTSAESIQGISQTMLAANPEMAARDPEAKNIFRNAPVLIFVGAPENEGGINIGLLGENICIAAVSLDLGTIIMQGPLAMLKNSPEGQEWLAGLGFSEGYSPRYVIGVGYPDEAPEAKPRDESKIVFVD